jgi:hypothetical protein
MITGGNPSKDISRDMFTCRGKWSGSASPANGLYTPTQRSTPNGVGAIWKGLTLTRTGTGLYTVQFVGALAVAGSVPYFGNTRGDVVSTTNRYDPIWIKSDTASTGVILIGITLGGTLTDPGAAELIRMGVEVCDAGQP